jgi:Protein of unknown function (DUF2867)
MRLPDTAHTARPWRIHEIAAGFRLEDVWELPTPGGPDDFPRLVRLIAAGGLSDNPSGAVRALWAIRLKAGELFGWDSPDNSKKRAAPTLRDRLPPDLRSGPTGPGHATLPFTPLYLTSDEWAAELVNGTVHGVMHIGWVGDATGGYRGQMAVLVRPNGQLGAAYMAFIKPLRHLIVYPALIRQIAQAWRRGRP